MSDQFHQIETTKLDKKIPTKTCVSYFFISLKYKNSKAEYRPKIKATFYNSKDKTEIKIILEILQVIVLNLQ